MDSSDSPVPADGPPLSQLEALQLPQLEMMRSGVLLTGGTWAREKALECAARVFQGLAIHGGIVASDAVLSLAEQFEEWLDRDAQASHAEDLRQVLIDTMDMLLTQDLSERGRQRLEDAMAEFLGEQ